MSYTPNSRDIQIFEPSIFFEHGFSVDGKFLGFAKLAIQTGLRARYGIGASVDLDSFSNQFLPRYLRSAVVIFERLGVPLGSHVMYGALVGDVSLENC